MKFAIITAGAILLASGSTAAEAAPHQCFTGPASRTFGGTSWLVYSCDDNRSMVAVSTAKNPAAPFVFYLTPDGDGYRVDGEGTGSKQASDKAGDALSRMSGADFAKLLRETQAHPKREP